MKARDETPLARDPGVAGHPDGMIQQSPLFSHLEQVRQGAKLTVREKRTPSAYQQAILDDLRAGVQAITVNATAGSGKSTLLEMIARALQDLLQGGERVGFLSFNTHIVKPLRKIIPAEYDVRTFNSLGHLIVKQNVQGVKFEPRKYEKLTASIVDATGLPSPAARRELRERLDACLQLHVGHALGLDISVTEWADVMGSVDAPILGAEDALHTLTLRILRHGLKALQDLKEASFLDQTLAPSVFGWHLAQPYDVLLVDELQDLSVAGLNLFRAATHEASRVIGVGDRDQMLYAFNGADEHSMDRFTALFRAVERPLSITYRCPGRHVELARPFTTAIEAAPGAPGGFLDDLTSDEFTRLARPGDLVLCRTNAPLVEACYALVAAGVPATVRGRDVARSLIAFARDAATFDGHKPQRDRVKDSLRLDDFMEHLNAFAEHLHAKYLREAEASGKDADLRIAGLADRVSTLALVLDQSQAGTLGDLTDAIRLLFDGDPDRSVLLSTIHGAKGLEADRVFILRPELLPFPAARTPQAVNAERCAQFVAYTRAKKALYFVDAPESRIPDHLRSSGH